MDTHFKGNYVQKKWKSIKDCYYKNLKNQNDTRGDPLKNKKPYIYHKQLTFLQSSCAHRQSSLNMADDLAECSYEDTDNNSTQEDLYNQSTSLQSTSSTATSLTEVPQREKQSPFPKRRKQDDIETSVLDVLKLGLQQPQPKEPKNIDPDEMFLLSQLPFIKNFSPADKMDFQIKYLQLVQSYANRGEASKLHLYLTADRRKPHQS